MSIKSQAPKYPTRDYLVFSWFCLLAKGTVSHCTLFYFLHFLPAFFSFFAAKRIFFDMKALVLQGKGEFPTIAEVAKTRHFSPAGVHVRVQAASLNHRDLWIVKRKYPNIKYPIILGSDGAGSYLGKAVLIQPGLNWGLEERVQHKFYSIMGSPRHGTFAQYTSVDVEQVFEMPNHLTIEQGAALPLAGLTAYRVLFSRCAAKAGEKFLITGIGGGVALSCLQFALAAGLEAWVTSSSDEKIQKAVAIGAKGGANYDLPDWHKELETRAGGNFDLIIDSAGGDGFAHLGKLCKPGGRIGIYGGTTGTINNLSPQLIFWRQISILGSTMGSTFDFAEMLRFVEQHQIVPFVDSIFDMKDAVHAFKRMEEGKQFGKIVLRIG